MLNAKCYMLDVKNEGYKIIDKADMKIWRLILVNMGEKNKMAEGERFELSVGY